MCVLLFAFCVCVFDEFSLQSPQTSSVYGEKGGGRGAGVLSRLAFTLIFVRGLQVVTSSYEGVLVVEVWDVLSKIMCSFPYV